MNTEYIYEAENWKVFDHEFFRIPYLNTWEIIEPEMPIIKFRCITGEDEDYFFSVTVEAIELEEKLTLEQQKENMKKILPHIVNGLNNLQMEELKGNCYGLRAEFSGIIGNEKVKYVLFSWLIKKTSITITFTMDYESENITSLLIDLIVNFFKIK